MLIKRNVPICTLKIALNIIYRILVLVILFLSAFSFLLNNQINVFGENDTQNDILPLTDS